MKLVMVLSTSDPADVVDAHIAFHLNVGVDLFIAVDGGSRDERWEVLDSYAREGWLHLLPVRDGERPSDWSARAASFAAAELGADWIIVSRANEFWWPRATSLVDVLIAIPPRYTIVQALARRFVPCPDHGGPFYEHMTAREAVRLEARESLDSALKPVWRADSAPGVRSLGTSGRGIPLRAWYPIEVLTLPIAQAWDDPLRDQGLAEALEDGSLVLDTRLRDALRTLALADQPRASRRGFALPEDGISRLLLRPPDVVEDAAYAVECAELGEVDLTSIERQVEELERRIAELESSIWRRVQRKAIREAGRFRRHGR